MAQSDRPFTRKLAKLAMLLRHGPSGAHFQDCWPHLTLQRASRQADGRIKWRGQDIGPLSHWSSLAGAGFTEATIIGSGPSIAGQDMSVLQDEPVVLLNGALSLRPAFGRRVLVAIEDERFVWRHFAMMRQHMRSHDLCLFSPAVLRALCEQDAAWLSGRHMILAENMLRPFDAIRRRTGGVALRGHLLTGNGAALSLDPDLGFIIAGTVAFTALQLLMATGARSVGLAGIDLSNANQPRFYENAGASARSGIAGATDKILNHFALALEECRRRGVTLTNYSQVSPLSLIGIPTSARLEQSERR